MNGSQEKGPGGYSFRLVLQQCFLSLSMYLLLPWIFDVPGR